MMLTINNCDEHNAPDRQEIFCLNDDIMMLTINNCD